MFLQLIKMKNKVINPLESAVNQAETKLRGFNFTIGNE